MILKQKITSQRKIQIALGLLWLLDGALQLQHRMFTSSFVTQVVTPAAQGQPNIVSGLMHFGANIFLLHPALFNALFALTQLLIGALILWKKTVKEGLLLSVAWGLIVWIFGEGFGGILSGHTLLLMGAPGAVLIYALLALAILPKKNTDQNTNKQNKVAYWLAIVWIILWVGGGIYQLLPGQNSASDVSSMISANAQGAPNWLASVDTNVANTINRYSKGSEAHYSQSPASMGMSAMQMSLMPSQTQPSSKSDPGYLLVFGLAAVEIFIGIGVLKAGKTRKVAIVSGIVFSLAFWVVGQSMGSFFTGVMTDPNSGPLFVLLGLAILSIKDLDTNLSRIGRRIEHLMVGELSQKPTLNVGSLE